MWLGLGFKIYIGLHVNCLTSQNYDAANNFSLTSTSGDILLIVCGLSYHFSVGEGDPRERIRV